MVREASHPVFLFLWDGVPKSHEIEMFMSKKMPNSVKKSVKSQCSIIDIVLVIIQGSNSVEFRDFASTVWFHFEDKIGVS